MTIATVVGDGPGWLVIHARAGRAPGPILGRSPVAEGANAGVVRMKVRGPRGTTIRLQHGEALNKDSNFSVSHLFVLPLRPDKLPPFQEVCYTLRGEGEEEYEPRFTVHGFRYAKVEGYPGEPHAQIFAPSASFLMDTRAFCCKWLAELILEQFADGKVGNFVPDPDRLAEGTVESVLRRLDGSSGWGDVAVIMPWALYLAYGDARILERQYDSMAAWLGYVRAQAQRVNWSKKLRPRYWLDKAYRARQELIWDTGYHWGEWLEPGEGDPLRMGYGMFKRLLFGSPVAATAYYANSARILARTAHILGRRQDAEKYNALAEQIGAAYLDEFMGEDGRIEPDKQASYVRVLAFDLVPEALKPAVVEHLVRLVRAAGNHIGTGFLSTPFLCHVLAEQGQLDVAYDLLNQKTIPSWLYAVTKGATTIWESWEGIREDGTPQLSLNHYSPGSVVDFLHRKVAGLDATEPGYRRIGIQPRPGGGLTAARASYESVYGTIRSEWVQEKGRMRLDVTIPANTRAVVHLPGAAASQVTEGGLPLAQAEGVSNPTQMGPDTRVEIGSGAYHFEYPLA